MATGSVSGRSRNGSRAVRPHRSRASIRHKSSVKADADEAVAAKPDIDEVRRRRLGYFSVPAAERRRVSSIITSRPKEAATTSTVKNTSSSGEQKRRRRKHKSSSHKPEKRSSSQTEDYVYGPASRPAEEKSRESVRSTSDLSRRSRHSGSSNKRHLPSVVEDVVTPDDSISQIGLHPRPSKSLRSTLKRSSTTPAKLPTIAEKEIDAKASPPPSRRSIKRDSSSLFIFGSIWRRNSTPVAPPPPKLVECLTCASDDVPSTTTAKLACGHRMCHDCLKLVFEMSVKDPAHMPPKCCTNDHIPLKHVDNLFDLKFKKLWNRKYQEYHTKNRIYCPAPKCGEWIKPSHIHTKQGRKYAECPRCTTKVCLLCNGKLHKAKECPKDPEIAKLVAQAKEKGWQTCYSCHAMVELKEGCNHMTCRCTAEFCMICGSKWKSCDCPWFNYTQLPDSDRLREMRVPEPIQIIYQRVMNAAGPPPDAFPAEPVAAQPAQERGPQQQRTYQDELDQRRRQERLDEDLARRMQLASLLEPDDEPRDRHRRRTDLDPFGIGNAAGHFMNDDFVQNAANVVMSAFGDTNMGRRGERASGRRRGPRENAWNGADAGLVPNFLGDESVVGRPR